MAFGENQFLLPAFQPARRGSLRCSFLLEDSESLYYVTFNLDIFCTGLKKIYQSVCIPSQCDLSSNTLKSRD